jgi:hypothetical protein
MTETAITTRKATELRKGDIVSPTTDLIGGVATYRWAAVTSINVFTVSGHEFVEVHTDRGTLVPTSGVVAVQA